MTQDFGSGVIVIGGGIVGLAVARALLRSRPGLNVLLLEKEPRLAAHQTSHNSGVIHAGLYYKPGSLKARLCTAGAARLMDYCRERGVPFEQCGKLVVAVHEHELPALAELERRAAANGLPGVRRLNPDELREREPHVAGQAGLLVPSTGIVDYARVAEAYAEDIRAAGGSLELNVRVLGARRESGRWNVETSAGLRRAAVLLVCGGLHSDRLAAACGVRPPARIVPFRGEYYMLKPERTPLVRHLIYPVPDPRFPFLGVHFTRLVGGGVECGPNAVLAFKREGYARTSFSLRDTAATFAYPGFWRLARRHWRMGLGEFHRSFSRAAFVRALQKLLPALQESDLQPAGAGVRAQALLPDGALADDFLIAESDGAMHVLNAPSPAATASLAIADELLARAAKVLPA